VFLLDEIHHKVHIDRGDLRFYGNLKGLPASVLTRGCILKERITQSPFSIELMKKIISIINVLAAICAAVHSQTPPTGQSRDSVGRPPASTSQQQRPNIPQRQGAGYDLSDYGVDFQVEPRRLKPRVSILYPSVKSLRRLGRRLEKISRNLILTCVNGFAAFMSETNYHHQPLPLIRQLATFRLHLPLDQRPSSRRRHELKNSLPVFCKSSISRRC